LILNAFLPPSQSGAGTDYGAGAGNTGFELLSSQLSRWVSQISDRFDININYRQGDNGQQLIDVATSTSIGERVTIDVSVSNSGQSSGTTTTGGATPTNGASNIVSDFNMEVKLNQDGRFRFKAFNRSNQNNILTNDVPYTQGVGLSYRREFNSFRDLFISKKNAVPPAAPVDSTSTPKIVPPSMPTDTTKKKQ
jgi:hypothetical protein